jgi:hypothetical protein
MNFLAATVCPLKIIYEVLKMSGKPNITIIYYSNLISIKYLHTCQASLA